MAVSDNEIFTQSQWNELVESLSLSPRQDQVTRCIFKGCSDKQIASMLNISVPTVRNHLWRLFLKLDVQDRNELVLHVVHTFLDGCRTAECPRQTRAGKGNS